MVSADFMKRIGGFVAHLFVLLVLFLWTVQAIFTTLFGKGKLFWLEMIALAGMLVLAVLSMAVFTRGNRAGVRAVYVIGLINILALSLLKWQLFFIPLIAAIVGIAVSFSCSSSCARAPEVKVTEVMTKKSEAKLEQPVAQTTNPARGRPRKRGRPKKSV